MHADAGLASAPVHGGDLDAVARRYGVPRDELLDFSANLNPLGPPRALLDALAEGATDVAELARYPEPDAATLRRALGAHHDVDPQTIVVANGAAALIGVAARVAMRARCIVPVPAFSEDAHALAGAGIALVPLHLDAVDDFALPTQALARALDDRDADAALVTTPHNPSGSSLTRDAVAELAARARGADATLVVDEAFVDFVPERSAIGLAPRSPHVIVVRSLTKFYAVPALRVGFAVCEPQLAAAMRAALPSWPVTTLAARALVAALGEAAYAERTRATVERERGALARALDALGVRTFPSAANFLLVALPPSASAAAVARELVVAHRIVVRDCTSYAGLPADRYLRVAVRDAAANARLTSALGATLASVRDGVIARRVD
ncbi:MAG: threonine-phosphate decarboxylase CobD [Vulcanimicrobiaceae bacterium]